jgi:hypothetical protein
MLGVCASTGISVDGQIVISQVISLDAKYVRAIPSGVRRTHPENRTGENDYAKHGDFLSESVEWEERLNMTPGAAAGKQELVVEDDRVCPGLCSIPQALLQILPIGIAVAWYRVSLPLESGVQGNQRVCTLLAILGRFIPSGFSENDNDTFFELGIW